ncbi:ImmA/IrrE family metallo-endopeptidase [Amycolatopsis sp. DG1A-15b]|uniref:ImmA/IrrE family metallo-endopeptidase n=1 Tax=Amycolatopsis sp. DG1A-15b TaxID=3052846 RepID=UPI00255BB0E3|nr:ImmA/IrrE family metallo-endopeptidase [Amycolatopsis sp. DG1A-15b]WIX85845.1 ImmA/IrrE family metallo-endopeptidase [Amycolatopsis sp. DG1A-15b]
MSSVTWRYLTGDTASFAVEFALVADDVADWMVDPDERLTWGALSIWVGGANVCEHVVQGEVLRGAHWYLLPILEWLVEQWDPLLHEERMPVPAAGPNAARGSQHAAMLAEFQASTDNSIELAEAVETWVQRHSLRASAPGALLPDLYIRRDGDRVEFSVGSDPLAGADWGVTFTQRRTIERIAVEDVANTLYDAVTMFNAHLMRRHPDNRRYRELQERLDSLPMESSSPARVAWLSGAGAQVEDFRQLWQDVRDAIPAHLREQLNQSESLSLVGGGLAELASPAALLFGSLSPTIAADDVATLYQALLQGTPSCQGTKRLQEAGIKILQDVELAGLTPGEQGSVLGEEAWRLLAPQKGRIVDVKEILQDLEVHIDHVKIKDRSVRAVSMLGVDGSARIVVNDSFELGVTDAIERFTLAHELGHLLLDQDRATQMIVASGEWAPVEIERRANAFAAAFLAPLPMLNAATSALHAPAISALSRTQIHAVAKTMRVSFSALVGRLQNIGWITPERADVLRSQV